MSIQIDFSVVESKRLRIENDDSVKNAKFKLHSTPKSILTETVTDLNDIVPLNQGEWVEPVDQDLLLQEKYVHYSVPSDKLIPANDSKKSHAKRKKKYLVAGLFSNYYKTGKNGTDKNTNDDGSTCISLAAMPFFDKYMLETESDFTLPYDLWYAHDHDKLYKNHSWNYKRIRKNVYADSVKPTRPRDTPQCCCYPEYGCGDNCLNRLEYTECESKTCPCGDKCRNMQIQNRAVASIELFMTKEKGWGVKAIEMIKEGTFIIEYVGEVISKHEFKQRMATLYINDIHHYGLELERGLVIDAHRMGSYCRFVNHSCQPNCTIQKWLVTNHYGAICN